MKPCFQVNQNQFNQKNEIVKNPQKSKLVETEPSDIIFKNNRAKPSSLDEQIDLFSKIIIEIYLQTKDVL